MSGGIEDNRNDAAKRATARQIVKEANSISVTYGDILRELKYSTPNEVRKNLGLPVKSASVEKISNPARKAASSLIRDKQNETRANNFRGRQSETGINNNEAGIINRESGKAANKEATVKFDIDTDKKKKFSFSDFNRTLGGFLDTHREFRPAYAEFTLGNISREALKESGIRQADVNRFDKDGNGFDPYELARYLKFGSIDAELLDGQGLRFALAGDATNSAYLDEMIDAAHASGKAFRLKDVRSYFWATLTDNEAGTGTTQGAARQFAGLDEFKNYMNKLIFSNNSSGITSAMTNRAPDWDEKLSAAYEKYIARTGKMTGNAFAATILDMTLGENSYDSLPVDSAGYRYFTGAQLLALNNVFSPSGKTFTYDDNAV